MIIYRNILESMADPELPVRVEAALALQPLIRHDVIRTSMQQNIPQIMQQLLKLANEVMLMHWLTYGGLCRSFLYRTYTLCRGT